jgi:hypothetical protein
MDLFDFSVLKEVVLEKFGVDPDEAKSSFEAPPKIVQKLNITQFKNKVSFDFDEEDGIYYKDGDKTYKGFLYIPIFNQSAAKAKGWNTMPKFHIKKCQTIERQMSRANFNGHYIFTNAPVTDMVDVDKIAKDLEVCGYCARISNGIRKGMGTTEYFENFIENEEVADNFKLEDIPETIETNIWGYTPEWYEKSKNYRHSKNYTCECCGIKLDGSDGYFLDTHHLSGNKTNNNDSNLIALCVLCHAYVDAHHQRNFSTGKNLVRLREFVSIFGAELRRINNEFV